MEDINYLIKKIASIEMDREVKNKVLDSLLKIKSSNEKITNMFDDIKRRLEED